MKITLKGGEGPILSAYSPPHATSGHGVTQRYLSRSPRSYYQYQRRGKRQDTRQEIRKMWQVCDEGTQCQVLIKATTVLTFHYAHIRKILSSTNVKLLFAQSIEICQWKFPASFSVISTSTCNQIRVRRPAINTWENATIFLMKHESNTQFFYTCKV